jgi:hypothetical protein
MLRTWSCLSAGKILTTRSIVAAAPLVALAGALHPAPLQPSPRLEPVEQGIERGDLESDPAVRSLIDQPADLVAVARSVLDQGQNEQLGAAFLQFAVEARQGYMLHSDILLRGCLDGERAVGVACPPGGGESRRM